MSWSTCLFSSFVMLFWSFCSSQLSSSSSSRSYDLYCSLINSSSFYFYSYIIRAILLFFSFSMISFAYLSFWAFNFSSSACLSSSSYLIFSSLSLSFSLASYSYFNLLRSLNSCSSLSFCCWSRNSCYFLISIIFYLWISINLFYSAICFSSEINYFMRISS